MNRFLREYWEERLLLGMVFVLPKERIKGYDYKGELPWPRLVAKGALHGDFLMWGANRASAALLPSEMYRQLEPFLYPYGKEWHTVRSSVTKDIYVGDRMLPGKAPRTFVRLPSLEIMQAHHKLVTRTTATATERGEWQRIVALGVARSTHTRQGGAGVV